MAKETRYTVIAECVDKRTGKRHQPGVEFPSPAPKQAKALIAAGCIEEGYDDPADVGDGLDLTSDAGLAEIVAAEEIDVAKDADHATIVAAIRDARALAAKA